MRKTVYIVIMGILLGFIAASMAFAADAPSKAANAGIVDPGSQTQNQQEAKETVVSIDAEDAKLRDLINKIADQSKKKIVIESTVKGFVPHISVKNVKAEDALAALCKAGKCEWRKVYLPSDSKLIEQPDRLAATVRLVTAMGFPEILIAGASNGKLAAHYTQEKTVKSVQEIVTKDPALSEVYVVTNDIAVAEKEKESEDKSATKNVDDYVKQSKELMDKFVNMTPEEQEQAMLAGINQFENMDPSYLASVMRNFSRMDPGVFARMSNRGTDMLLSMSQEDRRAFLRMSMRAQTQISPEVQRILQEDAKAVMEELQAEQEQAPNP